MDKYQFSACFPLFSPEQNTKLWLSLTSLKRSTQEIQAYLPALQRLSFDETVITIFARNLAELAQLIKPQQTWVASYFCFSATCNQMSHIARKFSLESRFKHIALVELENLSKVKLNRAKDFEEFSYLAIPDISFHQRLAFLHAVFLPETNDVYGWEFPLKVIRIGCPHGIDIPLHHTLHKYGGALTFDYVLSPVIEQHLASTMIIDQYPRELVDHQSNFVCAIPAGFPKLDAFHEAYQRQSAGTKKLIYHLSNWQLETAQTRANVGDTLRCLLQNFPETEVVFRPFPGDINRPELQGQIADLGSYTNLMISHATSYIDDYVAADILITHRAKTGQNFSLATGNPIFSLHFDLPDSEPQDTDLGMQLFNHKQLVEHVRDFLHEPKSLRSRIEQFSSTLLLHLGHSLDYVIDNFDYILQNKTHPDWHYLPLYSEAAAPRTSSINIMKCLEQKLDKCASFVHISEAAVNFYPEDPATRLFAAESRSRTPAPTEHTYFFWFHYLALKHICKAIELYDQAKPSVKIDIRQWAEHKGWKMAQELKFFITSQEVEYGHDIDVIMGQLSQFLAVEKLAVKSPVNNAGEKQKPTDEASFSFDILLNNVSSKISTVYLYGAGKVAEDFIHLNNSHQRFHIEKVFDGNEQKQGAMLLGMEICSVKNGINLDIPVVICSIEFKQEIELMLRALFSDNISIITLSKHKGWY